MSGKALNQPAVCPMGRRKVAEPSRVPGEGRGGLACRAWRDGIRPRAQDVIAKLLLRDPAKRLGAHAGAEEIKAHPFFSGINWALLRNTQPPFVPRPDPSAPVPPPHAQAAFDEF